MFFENIVISVCWFFGSFINTITGMGAGVVALPLISLFIPSKDVIVISSITGTAICAMTFVLYWKHIKVSEVLTFWVSAVPGMVLGVHILKIVPLPYLQLTLAGIIVVHLTVETIQEWLGMCAAPRIILKILLGFITGFFGGSISISGPVQAIYTSLMCMNINSSRGFFVSALPFSLFSLAVLYLEGLVTPMVSGSLLWCIPAAFLGIACGWPVARRINQKTFNIILKGLLVCSAISMLVKGISGIMG